MHYSEAEKIPLLLRKKSFIIITLFYSFNIWDTEVRKQRQQCSSNQTNSFSRTDSVKNEDHIKRITVTHKDFPITFYTAEIWSTVSSTPPLFHVFTRWWPCDIWRWPTWVMFVMHVKKGKQIILQKGRCSDRLARVCPKVCRTKVLKKSRDW